MADYFNTGAMRDTPSWHGKELEIDGGIFTGAISIYEQAKKVGMVYKVHKLPVAVNLPDGTQKAVGSRFMLMREPTDWDRDWRHLRTVANRYTPVQNEELIKLVESLNKDWPLETMGVVKDGQIVFFELALDPYDVGGNANETIAPFYLLGNDHTQGSAFQGLTGVRVVCFNTWQMATGGDTILRIPHNSDVQLELDFRVALINFAIKARKNQQQALNKMFSRKLQKGELNGVVEKVFPYPLEGRATKMLVDVPIDAVGEVFDNVRDKATKEYAIYQSNRQLADNRRGAVAEAYVQFGDEQPYAGDTAYALFNAITQVTNHSNLFTGDAAKNQVSLYFGQKKQMNNVAWTECARLVK